jgi:hypothetical protein
MTSSSQAARESSSSSLHWCIDAKFPADDLRFLLTSFAEIKRGPTMVQSTWPQREAWRTTVKTRLNCGSV